MKRLGLLLSAAVACVIGLTPAAAETVVVDTHHGPASKSLVKSFMAACRSCGAIPLLDAGGDPEKLRSIVNDLSGIENLTVVAIGSPAVNMTLKGAPNARVIAALASGIEAPDRAGLLEVLPIELAEKDLVAIAHAIAGAGARIAIVGGPEAIQSAAAAGSHQNCEYFAVENAGSLPEIVENAYAAADFVIFLKDSSVVNRQSANFLAKSAIAHNKYAMTYSSALTTMGVSLAISPNLEAMGARAAQKLGAGATPAPPSGYSNADFSLVVNCAAYSRVAASAGEAPPDLCAQRALHLDGGEILPVRVE